MKERLGTRRKSSLGGARLDSQGFKDLIFLISKISISQEFGMMYVNCWVCGGYSSVCEEERRSWPSRCPLPKENWDGGGAQAQLHGANVTKFAGSP